MQILHRVLSYIRPYWKHLVISILCTVMFTALSGTTVWLLTPLMKTVFLTQETGSQGSPVEDESISQELEISGKSLNLSHLREQIQSLTYALFAGRNPLDTLKRLCLAILLVILLRNLFSYFQAYFITYLKEGIIRDVRNQLFSHLQFLSLHYFHGKRSGQLISRIINDTVTLNETINISFSVLIRDPLMVLIYLFIVVLINWQLTLVIIAVLPLSLYIVTRIGRKLRTYSTRSLEKLSNITSILQETFSGIRIVKAFGMEPVEIGKFKRETDRYFRTMLKRVRVRSLAGPVNEFLGTAAGVLILWYGGRQVLRGDIMGSEEFMTFIIAVFLLMQPIKSLSKVHNRIQEGLAAAERVFRVLDTPPRIRQAPDAIEIDDFRESIRYRDVVFSYDGGEPVLNHIDLEIRRGEMVALVGASGVGKSTMADLLPRFYDPQEGSVELDGIDVRKISIPSLRRLFGVVTQETILFNDSVFNNIAYGAQGTGRDEIVEAARAANADEFIDELPQGYETEIGDRGAKLSGGQRQRIAIARALLKNPKILILDEATSALDSEAEIYVQQALDRLMENRTALVIAHRLSTVLNADRIVVLDSGTIAQIGRHEDLIRQDGIYKKLYELQFQERPGAVDR